MAPELVGLTLDAVEDGEVWELPPPHDARSPADMTPARSNMASLRLRLIPPGTIRPNRRNAETPPPIAYILLSAEATSIGLAPEKSWFELM